MSILMSYPDLFEEALDFDETLVPFIVVENREAYRNLIFDILNQRDGKFGKTTFSKNLKEIPFKSIDVITNIFDVTLNNKSLVAKLISEMEKLAQQDQFSDTLIELNSTIQKLLFELTDELNLEVTMGDLINIKDIAKSYDVKFSEDEDFDLPERLIKYINTSMELLGIKLFIIFDFKLIFSVEEAQKLYEYFIYNKIPVVILQSEEVYESLNEMKFVVDDSLCCIY